MRILSFNINGIRARPHQLEAIRDRLDPDVIGLQETKVQDAEFPREIVEALGYHVHFFGQKGHYGVALLSKQPPEEVACGFPGQDGEEQRRLIAGRWRSNGGEPVTVINGYFPQGEGRDHPVKFPYKERFYRELHDLLTTRHRPDEKLLVIGDMNIAPLDIDIGIGEDNRKRWLRTGKSSFLPEEREWMTTLQGWGLKDAYRERHPEVADRFSWFDYRSRGFERDPKRGLRIDLLLLTEPLAARIVDVGIDYDIRAMERPSDHCPVWVDLDV